MIKNLFFKPKSFSWEDLDEFKDEITVIYDPFFRKKNQKSKVNGPMQILQNLDLGEQLLKFPGEIGREFSLLVKRPIKGEQLWPDVLFKYKGKSIRYDLYKTF